MGTYTDYYDGWSYEYEEHCGKMKDWRVHYPSCKKTSYREAIVFL